jgi:hypothetical protein
MMDIMSSSTGRGGNFEWSIWAICTCSGTAEERRRGMGGERRGGGWSRLLLILGFDGGAVDARMLTSLKEVRAQQRP